MKRTILTVIPMLLLSLGAVAAELVATLEGAGPFTVFAPVNAAFLKLPSGRVDNLLKPENKEALSKVLTYHVVAEKMSAAAIKKAIQAGNGSAALKAVSGGMLKASMDGKSMVTIANVMQSNGVIHVVDTVLLPN